MLGQARTCNVRVIDVMSGKARFCQFTSGKSRFWEVRSG
jgi:hypothetical protein